MAKFDVYDLECLKNLFTYTGYDYQNNIWHQFVICKWRNDTKELYEYLDNLKFQVGYNNENYDYPLLHYFIENKKYFLTLDGDTIAKYLYAKSQEIINAEFPSIKDKNKFIKQLDLFRVWHYNNKARRTSLKDLEFAMRMENIEEMPIHHTTICKEGDEILILSYNKNDVTATYKFFLITLGRTNNPLYKGKNKIEIREKLNKKFKLNCLNYPDVKIGESLICKLYALGTNQSEYDIRKAGGTPRKTIKLKECIPHWANFETKEFNELKEKFMNTKVKGDNLKGAIEFSCIFHGCKIDYGLGGAHSCIRPGIYDTDDYWMILDEDIGSLYPSIAIQLGLYPQHLGKLFYEIYDKDIVSVRLAEKKKPKAERDNVIMEGYKLAANGTYGKSNEETSFLYDPLYTLKTTIGGQMFISLWTEKLVKAIPEIKFLQHNTDGITYLLPRKDLQKAKQVAQEMTDLTGLYIEDNEYSKMILRDVNNYIAVYTDSTPEHEHCKLKGCFEIDKEFHKDSSMRIVPIALKNYFVNNIPIRDTILNHKDIYDFCLRLKTNSLSTPKLDYYDFKDEEFKTKILDRTTRYYISKGGGGLYKDFGNGRTSGVNVGFSVTIFNTYEKKDIKDYKLNYDFYIAETYKVKNTVTTGQLELFSL